MSYVSIWCHLQFVSQEEKSAIGGHPTDRERDEHAVPPTCSPALQDLPDHARKVHPALKDDRRGEQVRGRRRQIRAARRRAGLAHGRKPQGDPCGLPETDVTRHLAVQRPRSHPKALRRRPGVRQGGHAEVGEDALRRNLQGLPVRQGQHLLRSLVVRPSPRQLL